MSDHADQPSTLTDEVIEHASAEDFNEFLAKCSGRIRPFMVRPELIMIYATGGPQLAGQFGKGVLQAIMFADLWLQHFHGVEHTTVCGCCAEEVECKAENHHTELGGFMIVQDENFDETIGGMVFAVCADCAKEKDEKEVYQKFSANIGGRYLARGEPEAPAEPVTETVTDTPPEPAAPEETKDIVKGLVGND